MLHQRPKRDDDSKKSHHGLAGRTGVGAQILFDAVDRVRRCSDGWHRTEAVNRKPLSVEVKDEADGRFVVFTYANGDVIRERVDPGKKPTRKPRRPPTKLGLEELDKTRRKRI